MDLLFTIIVTFFAGMGAGLGTGFAGMSAAAVISPILITFLGIDPYMAVGIALSSDVLASAISAYTYGKNKNLDIKNGLIMMISVLLFTVVGSYVSSLVPSATMGNFSVFMTFLLGIKFITWYLYNFRGMTVFSGLLFQYSEGWTRNGFMRMDTGALFGIVLCVTLYYCFVKKQLLYWLVLAFLYVYLIFVTQYRFQIIVTIILTAYGYYCSTDSNRKKNIKLMAISIIIISFVLFGGLDYLLNLFSLNGKDGGSTAARLLTINHYWSLIKEKDAILGVGFLSAYTNKAFSILRRSDIDRFWLEDLGILGGIFTFGILSLLLYGKLFFDSIKRTFASHKIRKIEGGDDCLKKCVVVYMILSCTLLNIFDAQRIWCMPFYLSIVYFAQNSQKSNK